MMDATLYCQFTTPAQLQACGYYFGPATPLSFSDDDEPHVDVEVNIKC
jgi:hypothetical protein